MFLLNPASKVTYVQGKVEAMFRFNVLPLG